ncbi:hypothetical protein D3C83_238830 [compost metagenome]
MERGPFRSMPLVDPNVEQRMPMTIRAAPTGPSEVSATSAAIRVDPGMSLMGITEA